MDFTEGVGLARSTPDIDASFTTALLRMEELKHLPSIEVGVIKRLESRASFVYPRRCRILHVTLVTDVLSH
jgi:hypothetical protein